MRSIPDIIASIILHILGAALLYFFESHQPSAKPIQVTYITAVQPAAKQKSKMPNRAASVESSQGQEQPTPTVKPKQNQNADAMKIKEKPEPKKEKSIKEQKPKKEKPKKEKKPDKINTPKKGDQNGDKRAELLRKLNRQKRLNALKGLKEREETSKDGVDGASPSASMGPVDAILGAYIEKCRVAILNNWAVMPSIVQKNPDLSVILEVKVKSNGTISNIKIYKSSGNTSFDRSAKMALTKTARLPAPPEKYKKSAAGGIFIQLDAKDKSL